MTANDVAVAGEPNARRRTRLRTIGWIVLVLGLGSASLLYLLRSGSSALQEDLATVGYARAQEQQMGVLYGKMGLMIDDLWDDLKRPGTQAILIAGVSGLIAAGCFHLARWSGDGAGEPR